MDRARLRPRERGQILDRQRRTFFGFMGFRRWGGGAVGAVLLAQKKGGKLLPPKVMQL
jgi:hypothetical protein